MSQQLDPTYPPGDPERSAPSERLERYRVLGRLGAGGMGQVLRVQDEDLERELAAKVLRDARPDPNQLARFIREAKLTGQLEHPNIVPVHELGRAADGRVYFTMKQVRGRDLEAVIAEQDGAAGPARLVELLQIFLKVCDAVAFAHEQGVIHRDLKPANIMVGRHGEVLVLDWGLAKPIGAPDLTADGVTLDLAGSRFLPGESDSLSTLDGTLVGTPAYMPPEQARTEPLDARSDVYSLGALLYQILCGQPPFSGVSLWEVLLLVREGRPVPPGERAPGRRVPWELEAVVARAMAVDPGERYQTAAELRDEIQRFLAGQALAGAHYGPGRLLLKWAGRHRAPLVAATLAVAVVLGGLLLYRRAATARVAAGLRRELAVALPERTGTPSWYRAATARLESARRLRVLLPGDEAARRTLVEAAVTLARQLGRDRNWEMAELMLAEAVRAGLDRQALDAERQRLAGARTRRVREEEERTRRILAELAGGKLRGDQITRSSLRLIQMPHPHVVRLLIPAALSGTRAVRVIATDVLARIGDRATTAAVPASAFPERVPEGAVTNDLFRAELARVHAELRQRWIGRQGQPALDAVQMICLRLLGCRLDTAESEALELALALIRLDDPRALRTLRIKRWASGALSRFYRMIGIPAEWSAAGSADQDLRSRAIEQIEAGKLDRGLALIERDLQRRPSAWGYMIRSQAHEGAGRREQALADARRAVQLDPSFALAWSRIGSLLAHQNKLVEALRCHTRAIDLQPQAAVFHSNRGLVQELLGRNAQALKDYDAAVELNPRLCSALLNRSGLHLKLGNRQAALEGLQLAATAPPRTADEFYAMGFLYHKVGRRKFALAAYSQAIQLDPRHLRALVKRATVRRELHDSRGALADGEQAVRLAPRDTSARLARGLGRESLGDLDGALRDLDLAARAAPGNLSVRGHRGRLRSRRGDVEGALAEFQACTRIAPQDYRGWLSLGDTLLALRRREEALAALRQARSVAPADRRTQIELLIRKAGGQ